MGVRWMWVVMVVGMVGCVGTAEQRAEYRAIEEAFDRIEVPEYLEITTRNGGAAGSAPTKDNHHYTLQAVVPDGVEMVDAFNDFVAALLAAGWEATELNCDRAGAAFVVPETGVFAGFGVPPSAPRALRMGGGQFIPGAETIEVGDPACEELTLRSE